MWFSSECQRQDSVSAPASSEFLCLPCPSTLLTQACITQPAAHPPTFRFLPHASFLNPGPSQAFVNVSVAIFSLLTCPSTSLRVPWVFLQLSCIYPELRLLLLYGSCKARPGSHSCLRLLLTVHFHLLCGSLAHSTHTDAWGLSRLGWERCPGTFTVPCPPAWRCGMPCAVQYFIISVTQAVVRWLIRAISRDEVRNRGE